MAFKNPFKFIKKANKSFNIYLDNYKKIEKFLDSQSNNQLKLDQLIEVFEENQRKNDAFFDAFLDIISDNRKVLDGFVEAYGEEIIVDDGYPADRDTIEKLCHLPVIALLNKENPVVGSHYSKSSSSASLWSSQPQLGHCQPHLAGDLGMQHPA